MATTTMNRVQESTERDVREKSQVFKLMGDAGRLLILSHLAREGETNVTDLCARLGQCQPSVSHSLALLRLSGLVEGRRDGKRVLYSVRRDHWIARCLDKWF